MDALHLPGILIRSQRAVAGMLLLTLLQGCASTLHQSVEAGDHEAVRQEIAGGASLESSFMHGNPLHPAIENNDFEMVRLLHENGAEILAAHMSVAVKSGARSTYEYLIENGADLKSCFLDQDYPGWWGGDQAVGSMAPPLGSAIMRKDVGTVAALIDFGAPQESHCEVPTGLGDSFQFSAILWAAVAGDPDILRLLIENGAMVNRLNRHGQTPISIAAERGHYNAVRVLLASGAFHTYTTEIKQPIEFAMDNGHHTTVLLLQRAGAVRPVRPDRSAAFKEVGSALLEGVKFAAQLYVIYLGARYSGYDGDYYNSVMSLSDDDDDDDDRDSLLTRSMPISSKRECRSDYDCRGSQICAKKYGKRDGTCVSDATNSGWINNRSTTGPSDRGYGPIDRSLCPGGYFQDMETDRCFR